MTSRLRECFPEVSPWEGNRLWCFPVSVGCKRSLMFECVCPLGVCGKSGMTVGFGSWVADNPYKVTWSLKTPKSGTGWAHDGVGSTGGREHGDLDGPFPCCLGSRLWHHHPSRTVCPGGEPLPSHSLIWKPPGWLG